MQTITAAQIAVADNPHGVDVRHLHKTPHVVVSQITLEPGEVVKPHKAPVDAFFYVLEGTPAIEIEGETVVGRAGHAGAERARARARDPQRDPGARALPRRQDAEPQGLTGAVTVSSATPRPRSA